MHLRLLIVCLAMFRKVVAVPVTSPLTFGRPQCYEDSSKVLKPDMTCDQLKENTCFYSVRTLRDPESATTTITDWNCVSYGSDHFVFNRTKGLFGSDAVPVEVKGRVWLVSNFIRLDAPQSVISISGWYTGPCRFPLLKCQGKKYPVYLEEDIGDTVLGAIGINGPDNYFYQIEIPC
ncbi:fc88e1fe-7758-4bec-acbb-b92b965462bb [Sclerotinia trifoliorum]|uniref:Fc88e1fe-7758-4bec-acbb-b92b965462bb n=1 Tax=Sclerotinia trifoliorum TaxID=28548 RepID=A0A8H2ZQM6_9HELO|nr:fc88e1fe-7758-4bec-acbb-b92b965462bb [Sclerotinia trifoliorum]